MGLRLQAYDCDVLVASVDEPVALVEVLGAERADVPLRPDELRARWADALEPRAARRAEDEVLVHALVARGTHEPLLRFREEALLRELAFVGLADRLARPDDEVDEQAEDGPRRDEQGG